MKQEEYGEKYQEHLLDQYKLYVEMADRISLRRDQSNRFYSALLTGLLAVLAVVVDRDILSEVQAVVFLAVALVGMAVCIVWLINIRSYEQLNSGKFKVVQEMEVQLPFPSYLREWEILRPSKEPKRYLPVTLIEQFVPAVLTIPYLLLMGYSLYMWICY